VYKNVANFHRLLRTSTVQSTERVKIFPQKFFALKVGLGAGGAPGVLLKKKKKKIVSFLAYICTLVEVQIYAV